MSTIAAMGIIDEIVEAQIRQAIARGDFDDLPGVGKPLALEDDTLVPEELRMAYRILKNAGYVPEEVRLRRDIGDQASGRYSDRPYISLGVLIL